MSEFFQYRLKPGKKLIWRDNGLFAPKARKNSVDGDRSKETWREEENLKKVRFYLYFKVILHNHPK